MKSLDITLGGITTSIDVASDRPPLWVLDGGEPQRPGEVVRELFAQARAEGVSEASVMAPRVVYRVDGTPTEAPLSVRAWLILSR